VSKGHRHQNHRSGPLLTIAGSVTGMFPPSRLTRPGLQVDPNPLSLLAGPHAYDESTYLNALKRRGSPLLSSIAASP
jgi:hypothetical protein